MIDSVIDVPQGQAATSKTATLKSQKFFDCSMFILKNVKTGEVLLMHNQFKDKTSHPFLEQASAKGLQGINDDQAAVLEAFFSTDGKKVGLSLYKNFHDYPTMGGRQDRGIMAFLQANDVAMCRYGIPYFDHEFVEHGFDVSYDPKADELKVARHLIERDPDDILSETHIENEHDSDLLRMRPFQNLRLFESSSLKR